MARGFSGWKETEGARMPFVSHQLARMLSLQAAMVCAWRPDVVEKGLSWPRAL